MKSCRNLLCLSVLAFVLLVLFASASQKRRLIDRIQPPIASSKAKNTPIDVSTASSLNRYEVRYERYGVLGLYHISLRVSVIRDGVTVHNLHIDGSGRFPKCEFNLGLSKIKFRVPPAHLAGSVNPRGYKRHFLGLLSSSEFGPSYTLNQEQGTMLVSMAHHAITSLDKNEEYLYCTFPFQIGPLRFWTSNSVVSSLVKAANDKGIKLPNPVGGYYPGVDGPFLPKALFDYLD